MLAFLLKITINMPIFSWFINYRLVVPENEAEKQNILMFEKLDASEHHEETVI